MLNREVPIITWAPWNPVAMKKILPQRESLNLKDLSKYSPTWSRVKYRPRMMVIPNPWTAPFHLPWIRAWWPQVKETPLLKRMRVFNRGMENASRGTMWRGGHSSPVSTLALNLNLKNAQKKEKKKKISLLINHPIDHFREASISTVWCPSFPSMSTSLAQQITTKIARNK